MNENENTDLPPGYRWASEMEMNREDAIVIKRTADNTGKPYTQDEADVAVPIKKGRPNKNYILQLMRDGDQTDPWGNGMAWGFAVCENLAAIGADIPASLGYRPSIAGPIIESYEDMVVQEYLDLVNVDPHDYTDADKARVSEVEEAARLLSRYLDWCKLAGRDY